MVTTQEPLFTPAGSSGGRQRLEPADETGAPQPPAPACLTDARGLSANGEMICRSRPSAPPQPVGATTKKIHGGRVFRLLFLLFFFVRLAQHEHSRVAKILNPVDLSTILASVVPQKNQNCRPAFSLNCGSDLLCAPSFGLGTRVAICEGRTDFSPFQRDVSGIWGISKSHSKCCWLQE